MLTKLKLETIIDKAKNFYEEHLIDYQEVFVGDNFSEILLPFLCVRIQFFSLLNIIIAVLDELRRKRSVMLQPSE